MNKYAMMLVAAGLIAAAPAYYAFQAQAEEAPAIEEAVPADDAAAVAVSEEAAPAAEEQEPAAGEEAHTDHDAPAEAAE